jgi:hypothetical protein
MEARRTGMLIDLLLTQGFSRAIEQASRFTPRSACLIRKNGSRFRNVTERPGQSYAITLTLKEYRRDLVLAGDVIMLLL